MTTTTTRIEPDAIEPPDTNGNGTHHPMAIIDHMVQNNVPVDVLERMMALAERYDANHARIAFAKAMTEAQREMPVVVRDAENKQTNSMYARLETVAKTIKPVYLAHGFSLSFSENDCPREGYVRMVCKVRHGDGHIEEHHLDGPLDDKGLKGNVNKTPLHGTASTLTYLERLLTCRIFNVTIADNDNDGSGAGPVMSEEDTEKIMKLIEETNSDYQKFLQAYRVESVDQLSNRDFLDAVRKLEAKKAIQAKKQGDK